MFIRIRLFNKLTVFGIPIDGFSWFISLTHLVVLMSVVELSKRNKPEPDVWQCQCGSFTFQLFANAAVQCTECKREAVSMQGYWRTPLAESVSSEHHENNIMKFQPRRES